MDKEYITNERFIWDELLAKAAFANKQVKKKWKKKRKIPTMLIAWPASTVRDDDGNPIDGMIAMEVPEGVQTTKAVKDLVARTKAYAVLACDCNEEQLQVLLESHHGTRAWVTPITRHGDVKVLGETKVQDLVPGFGVLYRG